MGHFVETAAGMFSGFACERALLKNSVPADFKLRVCSHWLVPAHA